MSGYDAMCRLTVSTGLRGAEGTAVVTLQMMEAAHRLADFLEEYVLHAHTIVVQCQAGISRSRPSRRRLAYSIRVTWPVRPF